MVVLRGQDAVLKCATNATSRQGQNPILWWHDLFLISFSPCGSLLPGYVVSPPDSATDCNIRALASSKYGISGPYSCDVRVWPRTKTRVVAMVIVVGKRHYSVSLIKSLYNYNVKKTNKCKTNVLEAVNKLKLQNSKNHFCVAAVHLMLYSCIKLHSVQLVIQTNCLIQCLASVRNPLFRCVKSLLLLWKSHSWF